jgi:single-strand DNA-binding protein
MGPPKRQSLRERRAAAAQLWRIAMINEAHISMTGYVATQPRWRETSAGTPNLTMRVAWTPRRMDRATGEWSDGSTSYLTVVCWRKLADNVAVCLRKGDPVVVKGRLSVRPYEDKENVQRVAVEVDAYSVGHDLSRGVAQFQRVRPQTGKTAAEHAAELEAGGSADGGSAAMAALDDSGLAPGSNGSADAEMFDEEAIAALANQTDSAAVPF